MKRSSFLAPLAGALLLAPLTAFAQLPAPPPTRVDNVTDTVQGVAITDPYRWLEDQESPETRAWIAAQNAYTDQVMAGVPGRKAIHARLEELLKVDAVGVPIEANGRYFFTKRATNQQLSVLYVRKGATGADEVLVDPHPMSADLTTSVTLVDVTEDGQLVAYGTRKGGADELTVSFMNVDTRELLPDQLPLARYLGIEVSPDRRGVYYSRFDKGVSRVYHHAFGTSNDKDEVVFGEGYGPEKIVGVDLSPDGRWLLLPVYYGSAASKVELWVKNVAAGTPVTPIVNDIDASFETRFGGDNLFAKTDWQAPNGRILAIPLANPAKDQWKTVVPEQKDAVIDGFAVADGKLLVNYLKNVASSVRVFDANGKAAGEIKFPALGTVGGVSGRWDGPQVFFTYTSFAIPTTIYTYDTKTRKRAEWWRSSAPVKSDDFALEQVWYTSKDGTRVPMFVLRKKSTKLTGAAPTILYGYGGFQVSELPRFSALAIAWCEMGGVYAVASLRGGSEFGEEWHKAGMLGKKQNVFDDFNAAGEYLIAKKYTSKEHLGIYGGSNGGLLVGACMTQRPDLYRAVLCSVPLLDMIRYHQFLVARFWVPEYGSSENPEQFKWLYAYSPYQHVVPGTKYPAVMFISGDSDTRVAPLHARKMCALMQAAAKGSDRPVLLHYDTQSGHSGGKPISKTIDDNADMLQFMGWQLGAAGMSTVAGAGSATGSTSGGH